MSAAFRLGPYDRSLRFSSPFSSINALPRSTLLSFEGGVNSICRAASHGLESLGFTNVDEACHAARGAIGTHFMELVDGQSVAIETSGGIDSSIALALALETQRASYVSGYGFNYPFYEFRYEEKFRTALTHHFGVPIFELSSSKLLPYSMLSEVPRHSIPSWSAPDFGANAFLERRTKSDEVSVLLSGHGADYIFLRNPRQSARVDWSSAGDFSNFFRHGDVNHLLREFAAEIENETKKHYQHFGEESSWTLQGIEPQYVEFEGDCRFSFRGSPFLTKNFLGPLHYIAVNWRDSGTSVQKTACPFSI